MPSSLRSRTPRKALSKSGSGSSFDLGDPGSSELDSLSTNGSISGESEDQQQPQQKPAPSPIPGMDPSWEKQEKTRLKNERKHQRHKERKLKDLRDRCAGVLMQRKLETLVYQLTSMGFTSDRAAAALALNEGDVEKSITFLLDYDGAGAARSLPRPPGNPPLKLDISEELAKLGELESSGYSLPDVERAVVACEGDFEAATRLLQDQGTQPKPVTPGIKPVAPPPPPGWPRVPGVHEAPGGPVYHPVAPAGARLDPRLVERVHHHHLQHPHRDLVADWRSSHPHPVSRAGAHRINSFPNHHHHHHHHHPHHQQQQQQQEFFQPPVAHHHQSMFNPAMMNSPAPPSPAGGGNWGSFESGSWNVTSAPRVDYQAIDWSVGLPGKPMGLGVSFGGSLMRSSGDQIHHQGQSGVGVSQQEWTSPFTGKDLFHHHPVHSL